jgi:mannitol 2-dehydrogenase
MSQAHTQLTKAQPITLKKENISMLATALPVPTYNRDALDVGVVHMSVGGFHRSHQAVYLDKLLNHEPQNWMIAGVGLTPQDKTNLDHLSQQDGLYTVLERAPDKDAASIIGSIKELIHAPTQSEKVINAIANPAIKILSLTITEKGYYYDENRHLDFSQANIIHDIALPAIPKTAYGFITKGLQKRIADNAGPITIMCCDNLPGNGHITHHLLIQFLEKAAPELVAWVEQNVSFPNAMVDRITPVTTPAVQDILARDFSVHDQWPVVCEDYLQWILEDKFIAGRPAFEKVGVQMVADVEPYEKMKVRLLNGSHSALSYMSYLMGYRAVDKAMADPLIKAFVKRYMDEDITPSVPAVPGIDLKAYKEKLIDRFSNPSISDQVQRLAEDGSQKIRNAIVPPLEFQLESGGSISSIALALAAWWRYLNGVDEVQQPIAIKDPVAEALSNAARLSPKDPVALLSFDAIFGKQLSANAQLVAKMTEYLESIYAHGMRKTLEDFLKA